MSESARVLITAGPTHEPIDPVRYLGNRSSGKMGFALAEAFAAAGAEVCLVAGPVALPAPTGVERVDVESAADMHAAVTATIGECDIAIFAAAVADFRPVEVSLQKIKKKGEGDAAPVIELERTVDILGSVRGEMGFAGCLVGFAAETEDLEVNARAKLERKGCDLVVANDVSGREIGIGADDNEVLLLFRDGRRSALPRQSKSSLAEKLVEIILALPQAAAP
jgi:phosphopantothenoylcysteine decarboxylase/phosphopantothenate--cysteine ligase